MPVNYYAAAVLIGGGESALDAIDGSILNEGDLATVITSDGSYNYILDATSGLAESSPHVIAPDTNPSTKRWILVSGNPFFITYNDSDVAISLTKNDFSSRLVVNNSNDVVVTFPGSLLTADLGSWIEVAKRGTGKLIIESANDKIVDSVPDSVGYTKIENDTDETWAFIRLIIDQEIVESTSSVFVWSFGSILGSWTTL